MLNRANSLKGYKLRGSDGEIGGVKEFFFNDHHWAIRYLIAETGSWLADRQVLISPYALNTVDDGDKSFAIDLSKRQIENSPVLEKGKPVSQQFEEAYYGYYEYPMYWSKSSMWGAHPGIVRDYEKWRTSGKEEKAWDPHLLSTNEVTGHVIQATDGEIGFIEDFILDDASWAIRYLIIDTGNKWPGKKVLISPRWIERVSWSEAKVFVNLECNAIKQSPEYTGESLLTREDETALYWHYNRQGYWVEELAVKQ